jgi:Fe2+ transport system protein FeoA
VAVEAQEVGDMMALVNRLRDSLWGAAAWKDACEAGAPVPGTGGCRGVDCDSVRLTTLAPGARGVVSCLEEPWTSDAAKLAGLGVLPGVRLQLVQRYPAFVLQLGRTAIAVDQGLASRIRVHPG